MIRRLANWLIPRCTRRAPDFIVGGEHDPYLRRWWLLPRNPVFNVYLHQFLRSDDDRALHDHPWFNLSIILRGCYHEHTIAAGGIHKRALRRVGAWVFRSPWHAHRVELLVQNVVTLTIDGATPVVPVPLQCWTLFITGPRVREWGFHCSDRGWVDWRRFTDPKDTGSIGEGCDA